MVAQENWRGFEPEDALYLVGPVAWLGLLAPFLLAAALGAPAVPPLGGVVRGHPAVGHRVAGRKAPPEVPFDAGRTAH